MTEPFHNLLQRHAVSKYKRSATYGANHESASASGRAFGYTAEDNLSDNAVSSVHPTCPQNIVITAGRDIVVRKIPAK